MNKESRRQGLVETLKKRSPEMKETLSFLKKEGKKGRNYPNFVWHFLLQSFATMGNSRGADGLIWNADNYNKVTFEALSKLSPKKRLQVLKETLRAAKVRMPPQKAARIALNFEKIKEMGGVEEANKLAFAQEGREAKIGEYLAVQ